MILFSCENSFVLCNQSLIYIIRSTYIRICESNEQFLWLFECFFEVISNVWLICACQWYVIEKRMKNDNGSGAYLCVYKLILNGLDLYWCIVHTEENLNKNYILAPRRPCRPGDLSACLSVCTYVCRASQKGINKIDSSSIFFSAVLFLQVIEQKWYIENVIQNFSWEFI